MGDNKNVGNKVWRDAEARKLRYNRSRHGLIAGQYIWCEHFNEVGLLILTPTGNYCDKCRRYLWTFHDVSPFNQQLPWRRAPNSRVS
jgi:hypothetical protein